jgi:hypothetical protein
MKFLEAYNEYLVKNPNLIHGFLFFVFCTSFAWWRMYKSKDKILQGLAGVNGLLEGGEVVIYMAIWCMFPIIFYVLYFTEKYLY